MFGAALQTCLGGMFPTAEGLCPAFSQAVRFIARAQPGGDPAARVSQGGRRLFRHRLGNPKYGSVNLCPSGSILHLVCTGQV